MLVGVYVFWECVVDLYFVFDCVLVDVCLGLCVDCQCIVVVGFLIGGWMLVLLFGVWVDFECFCGFCCSLQCDSICDLQVEFDFDYWCQYEEFWCVGVECLVVGEGGDYCDVCIKVGVLIVFVLVQVFDFVSLDGIWVLVLFIVGDVDCVVLMFSNVGWMQFCIVGVWL